VAIQKVSLLFNPLLSSMCGFNLCADIKQCSLLLVSKQVYNLLGIVNKTVYHNGIMLI